MNTVSEASISYVQTQDYANLLSTLTQLNELMTQYFDSILVMDKDEAIKNNRLCFLHSATQLYASLGDINAIVIV